MAHALVRRRAACGVTGSARAERATGPIRADLSGERHATRTPYEQECFHEQAHPCRRRRCCGGRWLQPSPRRTVTPSRGRRNATPTPRACVRDLAGVPKAVRRTSMSADDPQSRRKLTATTRKNFETNVAACCP
jgi:hypothetical protein